ncbi:MAG: DUF2207 domain-containing protein [Hyphomonadaceae bacterium]
MRVLALGAFFLAVALAAPALAREQIERFDVVIDVETDGDIVVTETIEVNAEGAEIRRGIFRDLPRFFESGGDRLPYQYDVESVQRDGMNEPFETSTEGNAFRVRVGDPDVFLTPGRHVYELRYGVKNQVRYFDTYDEVYWNVTGNYWAFPIASARATVVLPPGARVTAQAAYTGSLGAQGRDYAYAADGDRYTFAATRELATGEGLTVALGFAKGVIDPPSSTDRGWLWWQRNGALAILLASLGGLAWFLYRSFDKSGRDPVKGPVFPRYEAPEGYSPAAAHYIYYRALNGHRALIATLMNLAVKGRLSIDASDKHTTGLARAPGAGTGAGLSEEDLALESNLLGSAGVKVVGGRYDPAFTAAYASFRSKLGTKYGAPYFRWNAGYTIVALIASIVVVVIAAKQTHNWTLWHTLGVVGLAGLNVAFMYFMPAPTPRGQQTRTEIEGFRLYLETAEKLQLNSATVGGPPPMTAERYERFLPYAVALGVEKPWTRHFERLMPEEAARYRPVWMSGGTHHSLGDFNNSVIASMNSGVTSAMPQSSSSSGSGGGGSSGGGGGGGGGGGW